MVDASEVWLSVRRLSLISLLSLNFEFEFEFESFISGPFWPRALTARATQGGQAPPSANVSSGSVGKKRARRRTAGAPRRAYRAREPVSPVQARSGQPPRCLGHRRAVGGGRTGGAGLLACWLRRRKVSTCRLREEQRHSCPRVRGSSEGLICPLVC